jgi:hypothetical protein
MLTALNVIIAQEWATLQETAERGDDLEAEIEAGTMVDVAAIGMAAVTAEGAATGTRGEGPEAGTTKEEGLDPGIMIAEGDGIQDPDPGLAAETRKGPTVGRSAALEDNPPRRAATTSPRAPSDPPGPTKEAHTVHPSEKFKHKQSLIIIELLVYFNG